jgi:hypothetical protein
MSPITHAMNILGVCAPIERMPKPGHTVTRVRWDGCMATDRVVEDVGELLRYEEGRDLVRGHRGMVVRYDKSGERWEPLAHLRIVNGEAEIWT